MKRESTNCRLRSEVEKDFRPEYLSVKHTSLLLDTPISTIYEWVKRNVIPPGVAVKIGGRILINRAKLTALLSGEKFGKPETPMEATLIIENPSEVEYAIAKLYNDIQSNPAYHARKDRNV